MNASDVHDPEWHLANPRTRKWLVQCGACQRVGYRPDVPSRFYGRAHLLRYFAPLPLDPAGLCEACQTHGEHREKQPPS